jgi:pimeloyl-ACP methyl ester carboxylesterase
MAKEGHIKSFDGTRIAYRVSGSGEKTLFCFNGIGVAKWVWLPFEHYFSGRYRIVTWDYRGHGESSNPKDVRSCRFDDLAADAVTLAKKLGISNAYLLGHSAGFHVALELHRRLPQTAVGLVSCMGTPGRTLESFMESPFGEIVFDFAYVINAFIPKLSYSVNSYLLASPYTYHVGALLRLVNPAISGRENLARYMSNFKKIDFTLFSQLVATGAKISAEDMLPRIGIPTLIIASEHDRFVPLKIAKMMHRKIKGSALFIVENGTHAALLEQPDIFNLRIEKFLDTGK